MSGTARYNVSIAILFCGGLAAAAMLWPQPAQSSGEAARSAVKWEYNAMVIESGSLPAKVVELANEGWETQSVEAHEWILEQAGDNKPHLMVEKYTLVARRPANL